MMGSVNCVATHPCKSHLAVLGDSGDVHLWDFDLKTLVMLRSFESSRLRPQCCAFHPRGTIISVGFTSGVCKILRADDLEEVASFKYTPSTLTKMRFSPNGDMFVACDKDNHVLLFKYSSGEDPTSPIAEDDHMKEAWVYVGRHRSHSRPITGLEFGRREDGRVSLVSVGEDRILVEYNISGSNQETGLLLAEAPKRIEQHAVPTALLWHPLLGTDFEDRLVTANNEYKLKQWNADNKSCRKTTLGPTFGGPINCLVQINQVHEDGESRPAAFAVYGTVEKVVGLLQMPLDGNPHKTMGLIAHPREISSLAVSGDGNYLVTAGGTDITVNIWQINTRALQESAAAATRTMSSSTTGTAFIAQGQGPDASSAHEGANQGGIAPFIEQLHGGEGGELHEELVDYFYYGLLRTQGEDSREERSTPGVVPVAEVPNIMRALGYYPTEQEISHMVNEVKYSRFTETGQVEDTINLEGLIRLFVNHRPVFPVNKQGIEDSFRAMGSEQNHGRLDWSGICAKMKTMGEPVSEEELTHCLEALTGETSTTRVNGHQSLYPLQFAEEVLGFEDYQPDTVLT
ncbi:unnamed protein product [Discosporangium mesarthrocarpum]